MTDGPIHAHVGTLDRLCDNNLTLVLTNPFLVTVHLCMVVGVHSCMSVRMLALWAGLGLCDNNLTLVLTNPLLVHMHLCMVVGGHSCMSCACWHFGRGWAFRTPSRGGSGERTNEGNSAKWGGHDEKAKFFEKSEKWLNKFSQCLRNLKIDFRFHS